MSNANSEATVSSNGNAEVARAEEDDDAGRETGSPGQLSGSSVSSGEKKPPKGKRDPRAPRRANRDDPDGLANLDDTDGLSSGNDLAERECEAHGGRRGFKCSSHNRKNSGIETTESKSSNSHSPSPPSSSVAYSMLSGGSSEPDPPSTSGCSSDHPARLQTQRELLRALRELKIRMPTDHRGKGRSSTLASLQYALNCVKQVRANQEYYHQWNVEESHGCCLDLSTFTVEELDNITSEYTLQNSDTFSVAVSFLTGKVVYISPHASSRLCCRPEHLQGALFSELLAPQDVSTFYSSTSPCKLPAWPSFNGSDSVGDCAQEKSMFCRIRGAKGSEGDVRYLPFRLMPYQLTLRDSDNAQPQPCCLLIAEKVHSGYEAPRIPDDKRIFTTSHSPSCLFQEVDERAVPLLGYLPQDLVGTPMLYYLHPEDRPLMVAIHRKILQFAGQPFDHSSLRMCARSGEYLTIDTSWSSFINPWSRKVAFIVGRHKVRTSPLNEDVFMPPAGSEVRSMSPDVAQLSEQILRVLVHPVHCGSSQGYGSLGSGTEQHASTGSSSESTGPVQEFRRQPLRPMTFQQMCKDIHLVKTSGQDVFMESRNKPQPCKHSNTVVRANLKVADNPKEGPKAAPPALKAPPAPTSPPRKERISSYSYQQLNCLDSIIRYLDSCNVPNTVKRKCGSSSGTTSSNSDEDKQKDAAGGVTGMAETLVAAGGAKPSGPTHGLTPLALHCKAESVVSTTSLCSFSSTIVHVGDKKPPESDIVMMEETSTTPTLIPTATAPTPIPVTSTSILPPPQPSASTSSSTALPDKDSRRAGSAAPAAVTPARGAAAGCGGVTLKGLTKEVLSTHTQQEEQAFLNRFQDLSELLVPQPRPSPPHRQSSTPAGKGVRSSQDYPAKGSVSGRKRGRGGKRRRHQTEGSQMSGYSPPFAMPPQVPEAVNPGCFPTGRHFSMGPQTSSSSWPPSVGSQASNPPTMPQFAPGCLPCYPIFPNQMPNSQVMPPMMMAVILPNYMYPQLNAPVPQLNLAGSTPFGTAMPNLVQNAATAPQLTPQTMNPMFSSCMPQMPPLVNPGAMGQPNMMPSMIPFNPAMPAMPPQPFYNPNIMYPPFANTAVPTPCPSNPYAQAVGPSRSCTPQSGGGLANGVERDDADSPLFHSRCSSPLNLVQLEELAGNRAESSAAGQLQTPPPAGVMSQAKVAGVTSVSRSNSKDTKGEDNVDMNESNQDAMSTSSDLLDLLLQEDSRSGTGSAASGSGSSGSGSGSSGSGSSGSGSSGSGSSGSGSSGSGSNGCSTTGSGSGTGSSNTSKYFGSVDSSENDHSQKQPAGDAAEDQFIKYVLQDPIWLLMANTDDKVMMTYQLPSRDRETVLQQDLAILKAAQKQQPHFTEQQRKELSLEHPWILNGGIPDAINVTSCTDCSGAAANRVSSPLCLKHELQLPEEVGATGDTTPDTLNVSPTAQPASTATTTSESEGAPTGLLPPSDEEDLEVTSSVQVCAEE